MKDVIPGLGRVGAGVNPANPVYEPVLKNSEATARARGLQLDVVGVQSAEDFEPALRAAMKRRVGGLVVLRDQVLLANQERLLTPAATTRLPAIYGNREFVDGGGLMSYGPNLVEMYRRAAYLVDKILRGAKPADLPIEQATKLLARADEVME